MECLKDIVGVTPNDKECITGGLTSAEILQLQKSTSGLFLEDLPGGIHLKALKYVDATRNLAQMASDAIRNAIKSTEDDVRIALSNRYQGNKSAYLGTIGRMSFATTLAVNKPIQGLRIVPKTYSDATVTINRINIIVNDTAILDVEVWKAPKGSAVGERVKQYPVSVNANAYSAVAMDAPLVLPLMELGREIEYWVVYQRLGTMPKDTKIECSTCESAAKASLYEFVDTYGVELDSIMALNEKKTDSFSHGIILDVDVRCESQRLVCREYDENEAISIAMSRAVWYKAGELLIEDVIKQPDVNRYTTQSREYLWGKRNHFRAEYEARVKYMGAAIDVTQSNCYVCKETANQPFYGGIFS